MFYKTMTVKVLGAAALVVLAAEALAQVAPSSAPDICFSHDQMNQVTAMLGQVPTTYGLPVLTVLRSFEEANAQAKLTPAERLKAAKAAADAAQKALKAAEDAAKPGGGK
mgnify:CR=1 FL=1